MKDTHLIGSSQNKLSKEFPNCVTIIYIYKNELFYTRVKYSDGTHDEYLCFDMYKDTKMYNRVRERVINKMRTIKLNKIRCKTN